MLTKVGLSVSEEMFEGTASNPLSEKLCCHGFRCGDWTTEDQDAILLLMLQTKRLQQIAYAENERERYKRERWSGNASYCLVGGMEDGNRLND